MLKSPILICMGRPIDILAAFETASQAGVTAAPARYAIRQALEQEHQKYLIRQRADARQARYEAGGDPGGEADIGDEGKERTGTEEDNKKSKAAAVKRDFFGRIVNGTRPASDGRSGLHEGAELPKARVDEKTDRNVWVSFHEGFSSAVRKPITLEELLRGL